MTKVYFKRGLASDYGPNEPNLEDSIIFKSYVDPQFPGFSEVYLGSKLVGVGHTFGYGVKGLVPAPSDNDNGKILSTDGWTDPKDLAGLDKVLQNPISGSSQSRYPLILKGTADNTTETNSVNFSARYKYGNPILSATAGGDLFAKSLAVTELVKSPGFLVSNPNGSPISGLTSDTYIKADGSGYGGVFTGAGEAAGAAGLVPAPAIGDAGKYLKGDGTWGEIQGGAQSDWEEDDSADISYVQNRPAVRAGTGPNSVVEGNITNNIASGQYSHAEGNNTKAFGGYSHAEGIYTIAYDDRSHAEGYGFLPNSSSNVVAFKVTGSANQASYTIDTEFTDTFINRVIYYNGVYARIISGLTYEGYNFIDLDKTLDSQNDLSDVDVLWVPSASHFHAHTEGTSTTATGNSSHSEGYHTIALNYYEHAQGKHNKSNRVPGGFGNAGNTLNSIGIGTSESDRKNAVEVMQNGDVYVYGVGSYNGTNPNTTGVKTLQAAINNPPEYTIEKLGTAETGYISSYVLKKDGVQAGATINIPKDYLVKSGSIVNVVLYNGHYYESSDTGHTTPLDAYGIDEVGKYLKFVVNTVDGTGNTSSIYISVTDLVDVYTEGNGIDISTSNVVSIQLDSANANGLETTSAGLKLNTVSTTANGAMTAADKIKLDSINGNYWGSQTLSAAASYATTPEFQNVTINGDSTATQASTDHCVMVYDTTNKCLKFTF